MAFYKIIERFLTPLLLLVVCFGAQQWYTMHIIPPFVFYSVGIFVLYLFAGYFLTHRAQRSRLINLYLLFVLISAVRGVFMAEGYYDYKSLVQNLLVYLLPLSTVFFADPGNVKKVVRPLILFSPFLVLLLWPISTVEARMRLLFILPFPLLFFISTDTKNKVMVILLIIFFFLVSTLESRATFIRCGTAFVIGLLMVLRFWSKILHYVFHALTLALYLTPFVFLVLGVTQNFFIFEEIEDVFGGQVYVRATNNEYSDYEDISSDTRTFVYIETVNSAYKNNYVILGHSLSRGYDSPSFSSADTQNTIRGERPLSEVGILNVFTHMGLVGGILYTLIFMVGSFLALNRSRSLEMRLLGVWIAFRWFLSWFEEFTTFDLNQITIWMTIAMCYSSSFLKMDSKQFKLFLQGCFYRIVLIDDENVAHMIEESEELEEESAAREDNEEELLP